VIAKKLNWDVIFNGILSGLKLPNQVP